MPEYSKLLFISFQSIVLNTSNHSRQHIWYTHAYEYNQRQDVRIYGLYTRTGSSWACGRFHSRRCSEQDGELARGQHYQSPCRPRAWQSKPRRQDDRDRQCEHQMGRIYLHHRRLRHHRGSCVLWDQGARSRQTRQEKRVTLLFAQTATIVAVLCYTFAYGKTLMDHA